MGPQGDSATVNEPVMSLAGVEEIRLEADAPSGLWSEAWYRLRRNPTAILGGIFVSTFVVIAIFAPLIAPENPEAARPDRLHFGTPQMV